MFCFVKNVEDKSKIISHSIITVAQWLVVRKFSIGIVIFLLISAFSVLLTFGVCEAGEISYVGGTEAGNYSSIQHAINEVSEGDTIFVFPGIYNESIVVNKTINLFGKDKNSTILDGNEIGYYTILIQATSVNISGFTIQNGTVGIYVVGYENVSNNNAITNNNITNNIGGIYLSNRSSNNLISGNIITKNKGEGIRLYGSFNNKINGNIITENSAIGIALWELSQFNFISKNTILNNQRGITLRRWSDNNIISGNNITKNSKAGIYLTYSFKNNLTKNDVENNNFGIYLEDSSENIISENYVTGNHHGIYLYDSSNNTIISDNIFSDNNEDIWDGSRTFETPGFEFILVLYITLLVMVCRRKGT